MIEDIIQSLIIIFIFLFCTFERIKDAAPTKQQGKLLNLVGQKGYVKSFFACLSMSVTCLWVVKNKNKTIMNVYLIIMVLPYFCTAYTIHTRRWQRMKSNYQESSWRKEVKKSFVYVTWCYSLFSCMITKSIVIIIIIQIALLLSCYLCYIY